MQVKSLHLLCQTFVSNVLYIFLGKIEFKFHNVVFYIFIFVFIFSINISYLFM